MVSRAFPLHKSSPISLIRPHHLHARKSLDAHLHGGREYVRVSSGPARPAEHPHLSLVPDGQAAQRLAVGRGGGRSRVLHGAVRFESQRGDSPHRVRLWPIGSPAAAMYPTRTARRRCRAR